jgi:hypothetical protein
LETPLTIPAEEALDENQCDTFPQLLLSLPQHVQQMMGNIENLEDDGLSIATCLREGHPLCAWKDGSVKDAIGSHAWTIRVTDERNYSATNPEGAATTAGNPATLVSLRAEHSGTLAILYFLQAICTYYRIQTSLTTVKIWIDNSEVIDRTNQVIQQHNHSQFNTLDYDMWAESQVVIKGLPCTITAHHVKSHQDDHIELDDLTTEAYWNVMMDRKCERHREQNL